MKLTRIELIEILEMYNKFLMECGYLDDDCWCENPSAIDRFLNENNSRLISRPSDRRS